MSDLDRFHAQEGLVFGFVPAQVVADLKDIGNWKVRACAIDALHRTLLNAKGKGDVARNLPELLDFLMALVGDPNFKISLSSMQIIGDLVAKVGRELSPFLGGLVPKLIEKLGDNKIMVRQAGIQVLRKLMAALGPMPVLDMLAQGRRHGSWRVREEVAIMHIMAMMTCSKDKMGFEEVLAAMVECLSDTKDRVRAAALEAAIVVDSCVGQNEFNRLLASLRVSSDVRKMISERKRSRRRPFINSEGFVEFQACSGGGEPIAETPSRQCSIFTQGKIPWEVPAPRGVSRCGSSGCLAAINESRNHEESQIPAFYGEGHGRGACDVAEKNSSGKSSGKEDLVARLNRMLQCEDSLDAHTRRSTNGRVYTKVNRWLCPSGDHRDDPEAAHGRLPLDGAPGDRYACPHESGRQGGGLEREDSAEGRLDTWSPSKNERLAILKRRQQEARRVHSANAVLQRPGPRACDARPFHGFRLAPTSSDPSAIDVRAGRTSTAAGLRSVRSDAIRNRESIGEGISARRPLAVDVDGGGKMWDASDSAQLEGCNFDRGESQGIWGGGAGSCVSSPITPSRGSLLRGVEELRAEDLTPVKNPEEAMRGVIARLQAGNAAKKKELDWRDHYDALNEGRRLVAHHPEVVRAAAREFTLAALPAVEMLRSSTVRNAMVLFQEMAPCLGRGMDRVVDDVLPVLLKKAGEAANAGSGRDTFLVAEADKAISLLMDNVSNSRAFSTLLANASNKSMVIRSKVAACLDDVLDVESGRTGQAPTMATLERVFKTAVAFTEEGSQDTRSYGKRLIWHVRRWVGSSAGFERLVSQLGSETKQRKVHEVLEARSVPPLPVKAQSRSQVRQLAGSTGLSPLTPSISPPSRTSSGGTGPDSLSYPSSASPDGPYRIPPDRRRVPTLRKQISDGSDAIPRPPAGPREARRHRSHTPPTRARGPGSEEGEGGELEGALNQVSSKDWRERMAGLKAIAGAAGALACAGDGLALPLMDQITHRLSDGNSKVIIVALETLKALFCRAGERLLFGLNTLIPALASNLGSTNEKIRSSAEEVIDQLMEAVDHVLLIQNFSHCAGHGNLRGKSVLLDKLLEIVVNVYPRKPQLVIKHTLPVAFSMMNESRVDVRAANMNLIVKLGELMGGQLFTYAGNMPLPSRMRLKEMIKTHGVLNGSASQEFGAAL